MKLKKFLIAIVILSILISIFFAAFLFIQNEKQPEQTALGEEEIKKLTRLDSICGWRGKSLKYNKLVYGDAYSYFDSKKHKSYMKKIKLLCVQSILFTIMVNIYRLNLRH